jgi:hypothetical protein
MLRPFRSFRRIAAVVLLLAAGASGAYAYTNSITVNGGNQVDAGFGAQTVSGFNITNVKYNLHYGNPQDIDSIQFNIAAASGSPDMSTITILANIGGNWYTCSSGSTPTCVTSGLTVSAAQGSSLQVVAAQ